MRSLSLALIFGLTTALTAASSPKKSLPVKEERLNPAWLFAQPTSNTKDFYLLQFMENNASQSETLTALLQTNKPKYDHYKALYSKSKEPLASLTHCQNLEAPRWVSSDPECLLMGFSIAKAGTLERSALEKSASLLAPLSTEKSTLLTLMAQGGTNVWKSPADSFYTIFNNAGPAYRQTAMNITPSREDIIRLSSDSRFEAALKLIATDPALGTIQKALIESDYPASLGGQEAFWLAMIALKHEEKEKALAFLKRASDKVTARGDKDKALFWRYVLTQDKALLTELIQSYELNIYTLYAYEELHIDVPNIYPSAIENNVTSPYKGDTTDPFEWHAFSATLTQVPSSSLLDFSRQFDTPELENYRAYILERAYKYRRHYYISPFKSSLDNESDHFKALVLAIGRQESRFIETSLSTSYAMGVMQLMPFLIKHMAKERGETVKLDDFFSYKINMDYAKEHIHWLEERLSHPLWVAYAYNGGIGFTKRMLDKGAFKPSNPYEPFLSLELVPYSESRDYGKKVLTNYVIYRSIFKGAPGVASTPTLHELLKNLATQTRHPSE